MDGSTSEVEEVRSAKLHIDEIRTQKFSIGKKEANPLTLDLHHAVTSLSAELYQKDIHFLMELIQNAEDNEYKEGVEPTLEFVLTDKDITGTGAPSTLLVFNNEVGFTRKNIDSICSVGRSTKKGKRQHGFIGEKGIGFKSVFLVSSQPHIFSNGYRVRFKEEPDQNCGVGYVVPQWVSGKPYLSSIHDVYGCMKILPTTALVLPLKPDKVEAVRAQLSGLHPELLLFLSKVKRLYVRGCDPKDNDDVSTISIFSETEHVELSDKRADSRFVQLSVKEKMCHAEQLCKYYLWREEFPVKPGNRVGMRMDVEKWVITLAFPFGERLRRGTSSAGIFAFLPTTMVTNFPFIIQADFILATSRESIALDNVWNLGILECVPSAFVNAFRSCVKDFSLFPSVSQPYEFLPAESSPILEFNNLRESIRTSLQDLNIVPCQVFSASRHLLLKPRDAVRILPQFRDLLIRIERQKAIPKDCFLLKRVLHSSLNIEKYQTVLEFLGVTSSDGSWYTKCIDSCKLILLSDEIYIQLLGFIADNQKKFSKWINSIPLIKYINREGNIELVTIAKTSARKLKVQYAEDPELHAWLNKCNTELGCPSNVYFLPNGLQKACMNYPKTSSLYSWLSCNEIVRLSSAYRYAFLLCNQVSTEEPSLAVTVANFLYHAHRKCFLDNILTYELCGKIPVIDGAGHIEKQRSVTMVNAIGSKWAKLFGPQNPFVQQGYVDIGPVYCKSSLFLGESTPEKELLNFVAKYKKAVDLPELCPPDVALQIASHELSSEQAFLLLDWIRLLRTKGSSFPPKFIESIRAGKWMKSYTGYVSPRQALLPNESGQTLFNMMKHVMGGTSILDVEFYEDRMALYQDELKFLGVGLGSDDVRKLVCNRFKSLGCQIMSKECTFSLLGFISFSTQRSMLDNDWVAEIKKKKWLKTHHGYNAPKGSILLSSDIEAESYSKITNLPIIDEAFYGNRLRSFLSELRLLGVAFDGEKVQKLIAENVNLPSNLSSMTGACGLLVLKCIRHLGAGAADLIKRIKHLPWIKTTFGFKCTSETVLLDPCWGSLLSVLQVPVIDESYYGNEIRQFVDELKAMGVVVDNAREIMAAQFSSLLSSGLTPSIVMSLLGCIRELSQIMSLQWSKLNWLMCEKWLKTRHGYKTPSESIIFSSRWGSISLFVDLPIIDDIYYGIGIYKFRYELQMLGAITDFEGGAPFVAKGLCSPIEDELAEQISADGFISLLECIKSLKSRCLDEALLGEFLKNIAKSRCLKTRYGFKVPKRCVLFDPAWEGILKQSDVQTIDEIFYESNISVFKNELRDIGVNVDPLEVCSLLSGLLLSMASTDLIIRIYQFLNEYLWSPEVVDKSNSKVWIPDPKGTGEWVNSQDCILHDRKDLFPSRFFVLDKFYKKELLPIFSSAFGVAENPSINDYLQLWNTWALRDNFQVTVAECNSFWDYVLNNWNQHLEDTVKVNLTTLPATMPSGIGDIYMMNREEVFISDDLQLKTIFSSYDKAPLFVWFPKSLSSIAPRRLRKVYDCLGVKKISESVESNVSGMESLERWENVDLRNGLIRRGLVKLVLGFLAGPLVDMPMNERKKAAYSITMLSVYTSNQPIKIRYRLHPSVSTTVEVEKIKLVLWDKNLQHLLIDRSSYDDGKADLEFVTSFADELAQGVLLHARPRAVEPLSKIIQMGFMFDFVENEVDFLLMKENLELFVEDEHFLNSAFTPSGTPCLVYRKRSYKKLQQLDPPPPVVTSCKKQRK